MRKHTLTKLVEKALCLALSLSIVSSALLPPLAMAGRRKAFAASSIEKSITETYAVFADFSQSTSTSDEDKAKLALNTFDEIALLRTDQYNNLLLHLAADYHHHFEHRLAIETIMGSINYSAQSDDPGADAVRQMLREELEQARTRNPVFTVLDDVVVAFSIAYTFQFGKGLWRSTGSGLKGMERLHATIATVTAELSEVKKARLVLLGIGTAAGVAEAIYQSLNTDKMDPRHLLKRMHVDAMQSAAVRAASRLQELHIMLLETPKELADHQMAYRARITEMDAEATMIHAEIMHLAAVAPELENSDRTRITDDLVKIRDGVAELDKKMNWLELDKNKKLP